jgi:hypothetical protein
MRAPVSFKAALAAYQRREIVPEIVADAKQRQLAIKIIGRWKDHAAVETIWDTMEKKLPAEAMPTADDFIYLVLERRLSWEEFNKKVIQQGSRVVDNTRKTAKLHFVEGDYSNATKKASLADNFHRERDQLLGRKRAIAPRKLFAKGWSDKFRELCGDPLDEVVRVLTEIAYGGTRSIGEIRGYQKPTTRRARQSKATPAD